MPKAVYGPTTRTRVQATPIPQNEIAQLFNRWIELSTALDAAYEAEYAAEDAFNRAAPPVPAIILANQNEPLWQQLVDHQRASKEFSGSLVVGPDGAWIGSKAWQYLTDNPDQFRFPFRLWGCADETRAEWLNARLKAAEKFARDRESASVAAGLPHAKEAANRLQAELDEIDRKIMDQPLKSIDDLKMITYTTTRRGADLPLNGEKLVHAISRMDAGPRAISSRLDWAFQSNCDD